MAESDSRSRLHWHFGMVGVGMLVPWCAVCTAFDWLNSHYPGCSFLVTIFNFLPSIVLQPLAVMFGRSLSFNTRIISSFAVMGLLLCAIPLIAENSSAAVGYRALIAISSAFGVCGAVAQPAVYEMSGELPASYTNAVQVGSGVAGLLISVARMACLAVFGSEALLLSTLVYFVLSGVVLFGAIVSQCLIISDSTVRSHLKLTTNFRDALLKDSKQTENEPCRVSPTFIDVAKEIWLYVALVFLNYAITFGMFPTMSISTTVPSLDYAWLVALLLFTFSLFDFAGRGSPAFYMLPRSALVLSIAGRFVFWVSFLAVATEQPPEWLFGATWFKFLNTALFAFSNGYASTACMVLAPEQTRSAWRDRAGAIMSTALIWGIIAGSLLALSFQGLASVSGN